MKVKEMTVKDFIKIMINLVVIYIAGGAILVVVYAKTSPVIFVGDKEEKEAALKKMIPEADKVEELGTWEPHHKHAGYYIARKGGEDMGYIVETYGKGYSSYIHILVALDKNLIVQKIDILAHAETPGLGDEIERDSFKNQFVGKTLEHIKLVKVETEEDIQAITGVTISSRAVTDDAVRNGVKMLKERLEVKG
ncbi:MAG: RnfABCDGE type electron transport complex subunit G [Nitrospirota bacterium]